MPCRALLIESNPPTTAVLISPARIIVAAIPVAVMLARHTSFSVVAGTVLGRPPRTPAWRAGFWPLPPWTTLPRKTWSGTAPGARFKAPATAAPPISTASRSRRDPPNFPTGVLAVETSTGIF